MGILARMDVRRRCHLRGSPWALHPWRTTSSTSLDAHCLTSRDAVINGPFVVFLPGKLPSSRFPPTFPCLERLRSERPWMLDVQMWTFGRPITLHGTNWVGNTQYSHITFLSFKAFSHNNFFKRRRIYNQLLLFSFSPVLVN